ncbi:hypothetical protein ILYODFUR_034138, partial [Ilyodon furcidens]
RLYTKLPLDDGAPLLSPAIVWKKLSSATCSYYSHDPYALTKRECWIVEGPEQCSYCCQKRPNAPLPLVPTLLNSGWAGSTWFGPFSITIEHYLNVGGIVSLRGRPSEKVM